MGGIISLTEARRFGGITVLIVCLIWFSTGTSGNPLINYYPFSSLDVARFHLFMVPLMALLSAFAVERLAALFFRLSQQFSISRWRLAAIGAVMVLVLSYPSYNALRARDLAVPYVVEPSAQQALDWLANAPGGDDGEAPKVYGVGLWNWHSFLVPILAERRLIDGWHDEGADNVGIIRELRKMAWIGGDPVDAPAAYEILTTLGADYVLMHLSYWGGERTGEYWQQFEQHPELFQLRERWGSVGVFQVLPGPSRSQPNTFAAR